jgi:hypothetical protein
MKIQSTRLLAKIVIAFVGLICLLTSIGELFNLTIYFPSSVSAMHQLNPSNGMAIPYNRLESLRITILLTFSYFSFRYLIYESVRMYPIQFLDIMLKIYILISLIIFVTNHAEMFEYSVIVFYFLVALIVHFASRPKLRRYYYSKFTNTKN